MSRSSYEGDQGAAWYAYILILITFIIKALHAKLHLRSLLVMFYSPADGTFALIAFRVGIAELIM